MTRFVDVTPIGQGTYGKVYRAYDSVDKCTVAIKKVECMEDPASGVSRMMVREISLLKSLVHPNIVALKNVLYQAPDSYMVFEYMATDLHRAMRDGRVGSDLVKPIMFQVCVGHNVRRGVHSKSSYRRAFGVRSQSSRVCCGCRCYRPSTTSTPGA